MEGVSGAGGTFDVLHRPLIQGAEPVGRVVARGWLTVPSPARLVGELRGSAGIAAPPDGSTIRAIERALAAWGEDDTVFCPKWPDPGEAVSDVVLEARRLAALASLAALVEPRIATTDTAMTDQPPSNAHGRIRLALALEGVTARWTGDGSAEPCRLVPVSRGACLLADADARTLHLHRTGSDRWLDVGVFGLPARCPDQLLAAVEAVDWGWWALRQIPGGLEGSIADAENLDAWERVKRALIDVEPDAAEAALAASFIPLHTLLLRLEAPGDPAGRPPAAALIVDAIRAVERTVCGLLVPAGVSVTAGLHPPRTAAATVALDAWLDAPSHAGDWQIAWEKNASPFGTLCREEMPAAGRFRVVFSAGQASEHDLQLLAAPGVVGGAESPCAQIAAPVRDRVRTAVATRVQPDLATALGELRATLATTAADVFDSLLHRAIDGDADATAWVRVLHDDPRFDFACHPPIAFAREGVSLPAPAADADLEWRDSDAVTADKDLEVRFATDRARARRVLGRGRPAVGSAEALSAALVAAVADANPTLVGAAAALRAGTDRRRVFAAPAVAAAHDAVAVTDAIVACCAEKPAAAGAAFAALSAWCRATGCTLVPDRWHPTDGVDPTGLDVQRVSFHDVVPARRAVVERFGVRSADGTIVTEAVLFMSAGTLPAGFKDVARAASEVADDCDETRRLRRCVEEFPRRSLTGSSETAAAGLFDVAWKARLAAPERDDLKQALTAVQRFLDRSFEMIVFEPKSLDEYHESWIRGPDGGPARGMRIDRVMRPGLRTCDNRLVFPAIVEVG